jgi:calcineurin-like phosphoesterase family protein
MGDITGALKSRGGIFRTILLAMAVLGALWGEDTWKRVDRIVAVGDVHGDLAQFTGVLRSAGVIDRDNNWSGGKTHLVQDGDLFDRGPDSRQLIELLMKLEKQARGAGGEVHCLIGNHETMNLYGDWRYVSAPDYASYQTNDSASLRDKAYQQHVEEMRHNPQTAAVEPDEAYRKKWESTHPLGFVERQAYFSANGAAGKWIRGHNAVIKINDMIFLHGGISPKFAKYSVHKFNDEVSNEIRDFSKLEGGVVMDQEGPLWYRGLAQDDEKELAAHVKAVLERLGAKYIVIAHTPTKGMILPRFDGKVLMIDVGLSQFYGAHTACLVVENGKPFALHRGNKVALPMMPADIARYLSQIRAIDMMPRP